MRGSGRLIICECVAEKCGSRSKQTDRTSGKFCGFVEDNKIVKWLLCPGLCLSETKLQQKAIENIVKDNLCSRELGEKQKPAVWTTSFWGMKVDWRLRSVKNIRISIVDSQLNQVHWQPDCLAQNYESTFSWRSFHVLIAAEGGNVCVCVCVFVRPCACNEISLSWQKTFFNAHTHTHFDLCHLLLSFT